MRFEATANQTLVLLGMLLGRTPEQREPLLTKTKPGLKPKERTALLQVGLVELRDIGSSTRLVATKKAWEWADGHLDAPISKSLCTGPILHDVLSRLSVFLRETGLTMLDLIALSSPEEGLAHGAPNLASAPAPTAAAAILFEPPQALAPPAAPTP